MTCDDVAQDNLFYIYNFIDKTTTPMKNAKNVMTFGLIFNVAINKNLPEIKKKMRCHYIFRNSPYNKTI